MRKVLFFLFLCLFLHAGANATARFIPEIGNHHPLFVFEKNENPENIMVSYVKLEGENCELVQDPNHKGVPEFDFYWLMNGEKYKPVHPLIKSGIRKRVDIKTQSSDRKSFVLELTDLSRLNKELEQALVEVHAFKGRDGCQANAILKLGDANNENIKLQSIYSEAEKTLLPPFRKVKSIEITGLTLSDKEKITRRF